MSPSVSLLLSCVHELLEARDQKRLLRLQRQLAGYKLLIIDELGYVPLSQTGADPMMATIRRCLGVKTWPPRPSTRSNQQAAPSRTLSLAPPPASWPEGPRARHRGHRIFCSSMNLASSSANNVSNTFRLASLVLSLARILYRSTFCLLKNLSIPPPFTGWQRFGRLR